MDRSSAGRQISLLLPRKCCLTLGESTRVSGFRSKGLPLTRGRCDVIPASDESAPSMPSQHRKPSVFSGKAVQTQSRRLSNIPAASLLPSGRYSRKCQRVEASDFTKVRVS
ncbi:hypothetical protein RvY_12346-2 [Ramazzottius varieornatus]|uniref:Uncharacterized protein n=1 Tax=Ramazzottius varieornatus TaxID=947166 RepID=A0A1D1VSY0_RAMVA|nr:hypothetical protein RvY_12346-2 [Ramazzottius varieornatus]